MRLPPVRYDLLRGGLARRLLSHGSMSTLRYLLGVGLALTLGAGCGAITGEPLGGTGGRGAGGNGSGGAATGGKGAGGTGGGGNSAGGTGGGCVCNAIYAPVCGVDGVTYPSACAASCFGGVAVAYQGVCVDGGVDGGAGTCNSDSDCVFESSGCCDQTCVSRTPTPPANPIICNVACPIQVAETCGCVNHQCVTQSGTGGQGGGGGTGGTGGASCSALANQYAAALPKAQMCDVNASGQCLQAVISALSPCGGCATYVDDASALNAIQASWQQQGCNNVLAVVCPAIVCPQPGPGVCVAGDGGSGRCQTMPGGLTD